MSEVILHHYPPSPFAEKIRLVLGHKRIPWRSVIVPDVMPRPDLTALTGGYRRIPVMQIGADIYCDTHCIARAVEREFPEPTLYPGASRGLADLIAIWADRTLWPVIVQVIFGQGAAGFSEAFFEDRARLTGGRMTREGLQYVFPAARDQLRAHLDLLEGWLDHGGAFLAGNAPGLSDFAVASLVGSLRTCSPGREALATLKRVPDWLDRVRATGHGSVSAMDSGEAVAIARASSPSTKPGDDPGDPNGLRVGAMVRVVPDDYGRDPVAGEVVASSTHEIAIRRIDERAGEVVVHFPRAGFYVFSV